MPFPGHQHSIPFSPKLWEAIVALAQVKRAAAVEAATAALQLPDHRDWGLVKVVVVEVPFRGKK